MRSRPAGGPPLAVGIAGCGKIADAHVEAARAVGAEVVAVCDTEPLMAGQLAVRLGIPARYPSLEAMLDGEQLDVVHVTTPPASHPALVATAMAAGCAVFLEKPIAPTAADARAIVETARRTGRALAVNHWYDFDPATEALDGLLADGVLGEVVHVESVFGYDLAGDYGTAVLDDPRHWVHALPGKLFQNVLDHVVSALVRLLPDGDPSMRAVDLRRRDPVGEAVVDALGDELRFLVTAGPTTGFGVVTAHARPVPHSLRVYGTRGSARVDHQARTVTLDGDRSLPTALGRLPLAFGQARQLRRAGRQNLWQFARGELHYFAGMRRLLDLFYTSVRTGGPPPVDLEQVLRVATWIDAVIADLDPAGRATAGPETRG